ncbi:probable WRKY transcription factor protein 1 isoform X2 [Stomoxys calcitrans]|uniref:probable WRKY transcription factor protein 1 isoform X2 n=1 Tax=Stomoxys calcitrans TaxID=35570 RepID=UPI0027E2DE32|nr:probable WRKY transcription factor protein 1 isoform X2 [Stomoxys calcitrans]
MLAGIRKRLARKQLGIKECEDDDKDDLHANAFTPPTNYIKISQGKIQLVHQPPPPPLPIFSTLQTATSPPPPTSPGTPGHGTATLCSTATTATLNGYHSTCNGSESPRDKNFQDHLQHRIAELEAGFLRLQEKINNSQCGSPTFEKELRQQLENMSRVMKSKERRQLQTCRDHKALQTRFARQENLLHSLQQENKALLTRIRQYEHCLDDVMRKVVDAIVAEDNLREEVVLLKGRVRDLEAQNAALSASPAKGRDEGYCTMSSGQPQPSNGHLEDLPEEPEQWLLPAEPCSTEMEDWSMSQEELAVITLDESREQQQRRQQLKLGSGSSVNGDHDWIWNSNDLLNSTMVETDSVTDNISQLLQQKIIYSEDEEVTCTEFTNDFYKLVNIRSNSARSLYSYIDDDTDDEDDDDDDDDEEDDEEEEDDSENGMADDGNASLSPSHKRLRSKVLKSRQQTQPSPTPSEAGRAQVTSCSSSETDDFSHCTTTTNSIHTEIPLQTLEENDTSSCCDVVLINDELNSSHDHHLQQQQQELQQQHHSDIEIEDVIPMMDTNMPPPSPLKNHTNHQRHLSEHMTEKECIEQIIKTELSRTPKRHKLMKSQSTIEERETCQILRNQQHSPQHQPLGCSEPKVIRSGSVNGNLVAKTSKYQERLQNANNSWRRSNGWKRVLSPARSPTILSPKKDTKSNDAKSPPKVIPTRIPSCISPSSLHHSSNNQTNAKVQTATSTSNNHISPQLSPAARKSKIPPPVPVRRSYAS